MTFLPFLAASTTLFGRIQKVAAQENAGHTVISFPKLPVEDDERAVAISLRVISGFFSGIPASLQGWSITVNNNANLQTELFASCQVGAAAISSEALRTLTFYVTSVKMDGLDFDFNFTTDVTRDFIKVRTVTAGIKNASFHHF